MRFFGWKLVREKEVELLERLHARELDATKELLHSAKVYIERVEREVEYYREKYDEALSRADRQLDDLLQTNGLPTVTETTRKDYEKTARAYEDKAKAHENELNEIFAETIGMMHDVEGLELPDDLKLEAAKLMEGKKAS